MTARRFRIPSSLVIAFAAELFLFAALWMTVEVFNVGFQAEGFSGDLLVFLLMSQVAGIIAACSLPGYTGFHIPFEYGLLIVLVQTLLFWAIVIVLRKLGSWLKMRWQMRAMRQS